jgi:hypothetical protein
MATAAQVRSTYPAPPYETPSETVSSGVSWGAVIAGAFAAAALSLILVALGAGVGLSSVSLWSRANDAASKASAGAIAWLILVEIISSAIGGYLAGRLRTKWVALHTHEVYFRDTAHGFLVWCVGLVITAAFLASAAASMAGRTAADSAVTAAQPGSFSPDQYFADSLFRTAQPATDANDTAVHQEASLILFNALRQGDLSREDRSYLAQLVASRTGGNRSEAEMRVSATYDQARAAADQARRAAAHSLYWTFLALLIGAFSASFAATIGGKQRDHVPVSA